MKIAVIPARGGSKRIPRKNIRPFAGIPMIAHAIRTARAAGIFDHIIASTDDDEIADVAKHWGAEVPFRRPAELADHYTGTIDVISHTVRWCREQDWDVEAACCIYATTPLLRAQYITDGLHQMTASGKSYCFSVAEFPAPMQRALRLTNGAVSMFNPAEAETRTQDLEPAYHDAGQFYWGTARAWLDRTPIFSDAATAIVLPRHLAHDIDTPEDWDRAELLYAALAARQRPADQ